MEFITRLNELMTIMQKFQKFVGSLSEFDGVRVIRARVFKGPMDFEFLINVV